jgi:probable phosphomutase (TIGR03848 family)
MSSTPATAASTDGAAPSVSTVLLLRHARSTANVAGVLAGRSAGVTLDETGRRQAEQVAEMLAGVHLVRIVSSPLQRCLETVAPIAAALGLPVEVDERFAEVHYGSWTGRSLADLAHEDLWRVVQHRPSAAVFPDGEALAAVSVRAVTAVRELAAGPGPVLVCSHGDVLKAILADALGIHLDGFQRINVAPASLSVVRYTPVRPIVERVNHTADLSALFPPSGPPAAVDESTPATAAPAERALPTGDVAVGGTTG